VARGRRILAFSIDLLRRLKDTLALPCECVTANMAYGKGKGKKWLGINRRTY